MGQFKMPSDARKLNWQVTMQRISGIPLDMSSVFSTADEALKYVKGEKTDVGVPYIGQIITVASGDTPKTYCINILGATGDGKEELTDYCTELGAGSGADASLDSEIKVEGGPLADLLTKNEITTIPAGTTFERFVDMLTRKEKWPSLSYSEAKIVASIAVPTITFVQTEPILEVGTPITMKAMNFSGTTIVSSSPCKVDGFTYGYSPTKDGNDIEDDKKSIIGGNKTTGVTANGYARKFNITSGFDGDGKTPNLPSAVTGVAVSGMNTSACTIGCLSEGSNTITLSVTGGEASVSCDEIDSYYIVSNFGNRDDNHKSDKNTNTTASDTPTTGTSKTITGKYKYFIGNSRKTSPAEFDSDGIRNLDIKSDFLNNSGSTEAIGSDLITSDGYSIVIACPEGYELKTVKGYMDADLTEDFGQPGIVSVKTGEIDTNYNVYIYDITTYTPVDFGKVVISKK